VYATLILIDSDAELVRARALVDQLWNSNDPADVARLEAQARLIVAYEEKKWPRRPPSVADLIRHLMDQHGLTRADLVPLFGTPSRVSQHSHFGVEFAFIHAVSRAVGGVLLGNFRRMFGNSPSAVTPCPLLTTGWPRCPCGG